MDIDFYDLYDIHDTFLTNIITEFMGENPENPKLQEDHYLSEAPKKFVNIFFSINGNQWTWRMEIKFIDQDGLQFDGFDYIVK